MKYSILLFIIFYTGCNGQNKTYYHTPEKYRKELPENESIKKIKMEEGVWYWAAPKGFVIGVYGYEWTVVKDTAFKEGESAFNTMMDTVKMLQLEKLGIVKRTYTLK